MSWLRCLKQRWPLMGRYRLGIVATALLLMSACGTKPHPPNEDSKNESTAFMFREGTKWTFSQKRNNVRSDTTVTSRVTKCTEGRNVVSHESYDAAGKLVSSSEEVRWVENGQLWSSQLVDGKQVDPQMLYKLGATKGESWVLSLGDTTATHEGRVEITLPAGTYKNAIEVKVTSDADKQVVAHFWLVPEVGLVKWTAGPFAMELEKIEVP